MYEMFALIEQGNVMPAERYVMIKIIFTYRKYYILQKESL